MRITSSMMMDKYRDSLSESLNQVDEYTRQVSDGTKFARPSDDPVDAVVSLRNIRQLAVNGDYTSNVSGANTWLGISESAVSTVDKILQTAGETVTTAKNGTGNSSDEKNYAVSLQSYQQEYLQTLNTVSGGRYVFGGDAAGDPPFKIGSAEDISSGKLANLSGSGITFTSTDASAGAGSQNIVGKLLYRVPATGKYIPVEDIGISSNFSDDPTSLDYYSIHNSALRESSPVDMGLGEQVKDYQVAGGTAMDIATSALDFLVQPSTGQTMTSPAQSVNLYDELGTVATQLQSGDTSGLGNLQDLISNTQTEEGKTTVEIGAKEKMCTFLKSKFTADNTNLQTALKSSMDVNANLAITNLVQSKASYQAAQAICTNVLQNSLADFLK